MKKLTTKKLTIIMNKILLLVIPLTLGIFNTACNTAINSDFMENTTYIKRGDSTKIYWNFKNAKGVQIQGRYRIFNTQDSTFVAPDTSTTYNVTAFAKDKEELTIKWNVIVDETNVNIPLIINEDIAGSFINSISVIGTDSLKDNSYRLNYLALNKTNNFIVGTKIEQENLDVKIPAIPNTTIKIDSCGTYVSPDSKTNGVCFCVDNSYSNIHINHILNSIKTASEHFHPKDSFYLSLFNHDLQDIIELKKDTSNMFTNITAGSPSSGFCAINISVGITINHLKQKLNKNVNTIVLVTSSGDNASILYDENELLEHTKKNGIKIYVIAIGQSTSTYNLSKLASGSGGKLFLIDENELDKIEHYISEIVFAMRNHYFVDVNFQKPDNTANLEFNLGIVDKSNSRISDNLSISLKKEKLFSDYQVVAGFENNDAFIDHTYDNLITRLAETLKNNPNLTIELIGNSGSIEGKEEDSKRIALQRAQTIRKRLIRDGVNQEQIRITNNSSENPIYMFPKYAWHHKYNNRVEVRWLLVEDYPYEIVSDNLIAPSEEAAISEVESIEHKGFRAYYQRILKDDRPAYRIIIWGYKTEKDVNDAIKDINTKLKIQSSVRQLRFVDR